MGSVRTLRKDPRDQGNLPDRLEALSRSMAMYLRYRAYEEHKCDEEGYVKVQELLEIMNADGAAWTAEDLGTVVDESFTKEHPRFLAMRCPSDNSLLMIRASKFNGGGRSGPRGGGQRPPRTYRGGGSAGAYGSTPNRSTGTGYLRPSRHQDYGVGGGRLTVESFAGSWEKEDGTPMAKITGNTVRWHGKADADPDNSSRMEVIDGVMRLDNIPGRLDQLGRLRFDDGDVWKRSAPPVYHTPPPLPPSPTPEAQREAAQQASSEVLFEPVLPTQAPSSSPSSAVAEAAPCAAADAGPAADEPIRAQPQDEWLQPGMALPREERCKQDWDATEFGEGYLSLVKGELLQVQQDLDGTNAGWAYGYSVQTGKHGWFPPTASEQF